MKKDKIKLLGAIIFIIIQLMAFYGSLVLNGDNLPQGIFEWFGFCIFGIFGIILLIEYFKGK